MSTQKDPLPRPKGVLLNPHFQTIYSLLIPPAKVIQERHRLTTPDDDFLDIDINCVPGYEDVYRDEKSPIVIVLPSLVGNSDWGVMNEFFNQLAQVGIRSVGVNYRGCSGEPNRQPRLYYQPDNTDDFATVINWLHDRYPQAPIGVLAVSLGTTYAFQMLEPSYSALNTEISATAMISPPFDYKSDIRRLSKTIFNPLILIRLKKRLWPKRKALASKIDLKRTMLARTITEFNEHCIVPLCGYDDVEEFYNRYTLKDFSHINTPMLIVRSLDDPFWDESNIPYEKLAENKNIECYITETGGHVAFFSGGVRYGRTYWGHSKAAEFFQRHLI